MIGRDFGSVYRYRVGTESVQGTQGTRYMIPWVVRSTQGAGPSAVGFRLVSVADEGLTATPGKRLIRSKV